MRILKGDDVLEDEYKTIKIEHNKKLENVRVYKTSLKEMIIELSQPQLSMYCIMQTYLGKDNIIRKGCRQNGAPFTPQEFSEEIKISYKTYMRISKELKSMGVIFQGVSNLAGYENKKIIILNPFICVRDKQIRIDILELFENTRYRYACESEKEDERNSYAYEKWRNKVIARDGFKCLLCGRTEGLEVHHILPYENNPEKRLDMDNGVTLCKFCHSNKYPGSFHNTYGTKNNTKEQFEEYANRIKNGTTMP